MNRENDPVKIACVGNSITFGSGIVNRDKNAYPAQLQALLGDAFKINNFGIGGRTLLKKGDHPYWKTKEYKDALNFKADIVLIMLGTNDSKQQNRKYLNEFEDNYKELIQSFRNNNENIRVIILSPLPSFSEDSKNIWNPVIKDQIIPLIQKVAYDTNSELIDLYSVFIDQPELLPDGVHPSSLGATVMAKKIYKTILQKSNFNFAALPAPGSEYRSAAGWNEGKDWWAQMEDINNLCRTSGKTDLLLIGNSITQGFGGNRSYTTYKPGQDAANTYFKNLKWINAGISGDRTQQIAWRVKNGDYKKCNPEFVAVSIGVNNFPNNTVEEIVAGLKMDLELIIEKFPEAHILFFGPLPTGLEKDSDRRKKYDKICKEIPLMDSGELVHYYNLIDLFTDTKGNLSKKYYGDDGIHLKPKGYMIWARFINTQIDNIKHEN